MGQLFVPIKDLISVSVFSQRIWSIIHKVKHNPVSRSHPEDDHSTKNTDDAI